MRQKLLKVNTILGLFIFIVLSFILAACGHRESNIDENKLNVVATIYPVADIAKAVGGDKINLSILVPPGTEPHDWDPTVTDLKTIGKAKVLLYSGAGMEPVEKITSQEVLRQAKAYELSKTLNLLHHEDGDEDHETHDKGEAKFEGDSHHEHGQYDPHVWLDPQNMIKEVDVVVEAFSQADPANAEYYKQNGQAYKAQLETLDTKYKDFADKVSDKNLVVSHEAFAYLANRYGFKQVGIMGIAPDAEPTPERMGQITSFVKEHKVKAIFSEELVNPKLAEAISHETGAKIFMLNPIESLSQEEMDRGENYISLMEANLKVLQEALSL